MPEVVEGAPDPDLFASFNQFRSFDVHRKEASRVVLKEKGKNCEHLVKMSSSSGDRTSIGSFTIESPSSGCRTSAPTAKGQSVSGTSTMISV